MDRTRSLITITTTIVVIAMLVIIASSARPAETALLVSALTGHQTSLSQTPVQGFPQTGTSILPWMSNPIAWLVIGLGAVVILLFIISTNLTNRQQKDEI